MKLLIIAPDGTDDSAVYFGWFSDWIKEFGNHFDVTALNLTQHSSNQYRKAIADYAGDSDIVLALQRPTYALRAHLSGKPVYLWHNSRRCGRTLTGAAKCCKAIFAPNKYGCIVKQARKVFVGFGVNAERFVPKDLTNDGIIRVLSVGSITRNRRYYAALVTLKWLLGDCVEYTLVGNPTKQNAFEDEDYCQELRGEGMVIEPFPMYKDLPAYYQKADLFVDPTTDMFAPSIETFHAMSCAVPIWLSSRSYKGLIPDNYTTPHRISFDALKQRNYSLREIIKEKYNLQLFISKMAEVMKE